MVSHVIKLPDVGEGIAEAELVEWHVKAGDLVREDTLLAAVMTDKATVEIPSPVEGEVTWLGAEIGQSVPVGSPIVRIEVGEPSLPGDEPTSDREAAAPGAEIAANGDEEARPRTEEVPTREASSRAPRASSFASNHILGAPRAEGERPLASPAVRQRAREAGIDLRQVRGTGPAGRIGHDDLAAFLELGTQAATQTALEHRDDIQDVRVLGLRRRIAEKMTLANSRIPHITYIEEVDVTDLETLRGKLNHSERSDRPKLTLLPFLMRAMVKAIAEQPQMNALFDDEAGVVHRHGAVHIGIAVQTSAGLTVPVVRHAEARDLFDCASEAARLADATRAGAAQRGELIGSTITITSLGAMGGVATTPVINHPEVAIIGVNKMVMRPVWDGAHFVPRRMMNLSSSFDHRVIDGWDAAVFVQRLKILLETPALIFVET